MRVEEPLRAVVGGMAIMVERVAVGGRAVTASFASRGEQLERRSREAAGRYVDGWLDRLLVPLVDRAIPIVIERLGDRREELRLLVREHGEDLTGELVAGIRERAEAGDAAAERTARRLLGRTRNVPAPPEPAPTGGSAAGP